MDKAYVEDEPLLVFITISLSLWFICYFVGSAKMQMSLEAIHHLVPSALENYQHPLANNGTSILNCVCRAFDHSAI
jgi:hypothetical protein